MYLITFCFLRNFRSEKLFAQSFGTREARKIEPWYELSFQNVYWAIKLKLSKRIFKKESINPITIKRPPPKILSASPAKIKTFENIFFLAFSRQRQNTKSFLCFN
jgi:hypothetical protein